MDTGLRGHNFQLAVGLWVGSATSKTYLATITGQLDSPDTAHSFASGRIIVKQGDHLVQNSRRDKRLDAHMLRCRARSP